MSTTQEYQEKIKHHKGNDHYTRELSENERKQIIIKVSESRYYITKLQHMLAFTTWSAMKCGYLLHFPHIFERMSNNTQPQHKILLQEKANERERKKQQLRVRKHNWESKKNCD